MITLRRRELLNLFDVEASKDLVRSPLTETLGATASALNAFLGEDVVLALFCHYWNGPDGGPGTAKVHTFDCRERKGKWLDAWIAIDGGSNRLFQTEVKNWTAHSIGGHYTLRPDASRDEVVTRAKQQWARWIDDPKNRPRIEKVRTCSPELLEGFELSEPLLCFWGPLLRSEEPQLKPFFKIPDSDHYLKQVSVFSASIYLRLVEENEFVLELPRVEQRIQRLRNLGVLE